MRLEEHLVCICTKDQFYDVKAGSEINRIAKMCNSKNQNSHSNHIHRGQAKSQ